LLKPILNFVFIVSARQNPENLGAFLLVAWTRRIGVAGETDD
jgi:hypothetical protein